MVGLLVTQQFAQPERWDGIAWLMIKSLVAFGIVVYLAITVTRLWVRKGAGIVTGPKRHLHLIEHLPLGAGKGIFLVKVLDAVLLISVTDKSIAVLQEFPMSPEFEVSDAASTSNWLEQFISKLREKASATDDASSQQSPPSSLNFAQELRQRLNRLKEPRS